MAKAKVTDKGNVQVTMSVDQFISIGAILSHVRLGDDSTMKSAISDLLIDLETFEHENGIHEVIMESAEQVYASFDTHGGEWAIEINAE